MPDKPSPLQSPLPPFQALEELKRGLAQGEVRPEALLALLESFPPEIHWLLARNPQLEIFKPGIYESIHYLLKLATITDDETLTPAMSRDLAVCRIICKGLFKLDLNRYLQIPAIWFQIAEQSKCQAPVSKTNLKAHDAHCFGGLRMSRSSELFPVLIERMQLASSDKSDSFHLDLKHALSERTDVRPEMLFTDLQVPLLVQCLIAHWAPLYYRREPHFGLCDFTYSAIGQFCSFRLDPNKLLADDRFDQENIRNTVRTIGLKKSKELKVTSFESHEGEDRLQVDGQTVILRKQ